MPRNTREVLPGLPHHVTQRGVDRMRLFHSPSDHRVYLDLVRENLDDARVRLLAYCLMSNHVHLVVIPEHGDSLAVLFRRVHGRYAQYFNVRRRRTGHLWQARPYSCVMSPDHLIAGLRYVETNPVRAGMVCSPEEYRWSSAAEHLTRLHETSLLDRADWEARGGAAGWRFLLEQPNPRVLENHLRRCTHAERPFGDEQFVARIESQTGRNWRRWPFHAALADAQRHLTLAALLPEFGLFSTSIPQSGTDRSAPHF